MVLRNNQLTVFYILTILMCVFRANTLKCHQTQYQRDENQCCSKCPIGVAVHQRWRKSSAQNTQRGTHVRNDCTKLGSTSCRVCVKDTYMNIPTGLKHCFPCTNCNAGSGLQVKRECTTMSDAVCKPLEGFFCVDPVADSCLRARKHKRCQPGQYISQKGTPSNDTICFDCADETFSTGNFTVCQPHKKCESEYLLINPGTRSTDAECGRRRYVLFIVILFVLILCISVLVWRIKRSNRQEI
ncbi:tumor necrosis factor receptor superfamily member 14-like isoform X1 [Corythoichthys intestinalis]|uniref:tumor necrosis factor receptor superfamily member 14-like isoform X1 n=1 Tax=Corythoichthys intestinalis TaxID=161448 RepID=UPI0025A60E41|nr:tumor necrosis factor receptor superfamily member 14-like isoform X1 [Corythoichthys intestinalis]XP_057677864.1 tumor necrosis factor receptor superfamily member 14-like isoform X1 [Corythoichthys intestinalis]